jgi:hypothetical protein
MGKSHKTVLMGLLAVVMVCLMLSTATTTVTATDGWGTLKAGDEMQWQSSTYGTVSMKILSVEGDTITLEITKGGSKKALTIDANEALDDVNMSAIGPYLQPKDTLTGQTKTYDFEGTTYQTDYSKSTYGDDSFSEFWIDKNTGILFEWSYTAADGTAA